MQGKNNVYKTNRKKKEGKKKSIWEEAETDSNKVSNVIELVTEYCKENDGE